MKTTINRYCPICNEKTEHIYIGNQKGINGKSLELYDCIFCKDTYCEREEDPKTWSDDDIGLVRMFNLKN